MGDYDISVRKMANEIMQKYDHNRNGVIDLPGSPEASFGKDETIFTQRMTGLCGNPTYAYSYRNLFEAADVNHDRHVTRDELENVIRRFDKEGKGALTTQDE